MSLTQRIINITALALSFAGSINAGPIIGLCNTAKTFKYDSIGTIYISDENILTITSPTDDSKTIITLRDLPSEGSICLTLDKKNIVIVDSNKRALIFLLFQDSSRTTIFHPASKQQIPLPHGSETSVIELLEAFAPSQTTEKLASAQATSVTLEP